MSDSSFLMSINGQIEWIKVLASADSIFHCKYEFVFGSDWKILRGIEAGVSQNASVLTNGEKITLNFPIEVVLKSTNPFQWPQLILSVYKDMKLVGYGRTHMPTQPGFDEQDIPLVRPVPSSLLGYFGTFFGYQPELLQPKMLATTAGNDLITMVSDGNVGISLNITLQGLSKLGYDVGKPKRA